MRFFRWRLVLDLVFGFTGRVLKRDEEEAAMVDADEAAQVALLESLRIAGAPPVGGSPPPGLELELPDGAPPPCEVGEEEVSGLADAVAAANMALLQSVPAAAAPPRDDNRSRVVPDAGLSPRPSPSKAPRPPQPAGED